MRKNFLLRLPVFFLRLVCPAFLLLVTASCVFSPADNRPWVFADLRAISALDAPTPATDILAIYTRTTDMTVDIRVDLLDIEPGDQFILKIALWDNRDFSQNPLVINIPSSGMLQVSGIGEGKPAILPRVVQDFGLDTITVDLNRFFIGQRYRLDVTTYTTDPVTLADEVDNIRSDAQPPAKRAPVLIAFWDTFPATTPVQAIRHWNGAHTGPLGDRHGLVQILNGAGQYGVPIALLDIKNPASLAALDFMGNIPLLAKLYDRGLLILPDVAYSEPADVALDLSRRASTAFGMPASQFVFATSPDSSIQSAPLTSYRARFLPRTDSSHLAISGGMRLIPLPATDAVQATENGPALDVRRALIKAAASPDPAELVVLGGSVPHSTWGDSNIAYPTFEWIAYHPWIQPLSSHDLLAFPAQLQPVASTPVTVPSAWLEKLESTPQNFVTQSAWQTYLTLTAYTADARLQALNNAYLGQVGELLVAAAWAKTPTTRVDCKDDLNGDGKAECILASQNTFAVLESKGARLTQLFCIDENGPHQLVGPSSQFAVGLSDPSEWHPENGEAADPSVIPGAFVDDTSTWADYTPTITGDSITFSSPDGSRVKTYRLMTNGIQAFYRSNGPVNTRIPLALDPLRFYFDPSNYFAMFAPHSWTWSISNGRSVEVRTDANLSAEGFISAIPFLSLLEDPDLDYPKGIYLPFPLSVTTIQSGGVFSTQIILK